jgi:hypothetical protein
MGYSDMNKKPFEPLTLVADGYETVKSHVESKSELLDVAKRTMSFLNGFTRTSHLSYYHLSTI